MPGTAHDRTFLDNVVTSTWVFEGEGRWSPSQPPDERVTIAVLPFADLSPRKDQEYFCYGIAAEILCALTKLEALRVVSRTSTIRFTGKDYDVREIGRQLNVRMVLEGSVRKAGERVRITTQLVSVADGYGLWSETYDRDLKDVFTIHDAISQAVVNALRVQCVGQKDTQFLKP